MLPSRPSSRLVAQPLFSAMSEAKNRAGLLACFGEPLKDDATMIECSYHPPQSSTFFLASLTRFLLHLRPRPPGLSILRMYSLPPDELFIKWETFLLNHLRPAKDGQPHKFSLDHARELRKEIQREVSAKGNAGGMNKSAGGTPGGAASAKARMGGIGGVGGGGGNKRQSMGGLDL
jgi:hypothetical protein